MTCRPLGIALLVFALPLAAGACARPVGAVRVDPQKVQRELTGIIEEVWRILRQDADAK